MDNLLKETERELKGEGYTFDDVASIQGENIRISVERFKELANVDYDDGYGSPEVATDLVLIMKDGCWFERVDYDGDEEWAFRKCPQILENINDAAVKRLTTDGDVGWKTLEKLQEDDD